jgi:ferredoxin
MSRASSLARLAAAYAAHQVRRRFRRPEGGVERLLDTYAEDRLLPLHAAERDLLPGAGRCINCGLCSVVLARAGGLRPSDLASAYLRDYPRLGLVRSEVAGSDGTIAVDDPDVAAAAAACPVGVPLEGVLEMIRRLASA